MLIEFALENVLLLSAVFVIAMVTIINQRKLTALPLILVIGTLLYGGVEMLKMARKEAQVVEVMAQPTVKKVVPVTKKVKKVRR